MFSTFKIQTKASEEVLVNRLKKNTKISSQYFPIYGEFSFNWKNLGEEKPKIKMSGFYIFRCYQGLVKFKQNSKGTVIHVTVLPDTLLLLFFIFAFGFISYSIITVTFPLQGTPEFLPSLVINLVGLLLFFLIGMLALYGVGIRLKKDIIKSLSGKG